MNQSHKSASEQEDRYDVMQGTYFKDFVKYVWATPKLLSMPVLVRVALETALNGKHSIYHHNHPYVVIELLLDGEMTFRSGRKQKILKSGAIAIFHRNSDCGFSTTKNKFCHKLSLIASGTTLDPFLRALNLADCCFLENIDVREMEKRFREIMELLRNQVPGTEFTLSEKVYSLFLRFSELWNSGRQEYPRPLILALEYMERSFRESLRIKDLAGVAGVGRATLFRLFNRHLHKNPHEWLEKLRMEFASTLLRSGQNVKESAFNSGYPNPLNFSTAFRKYFGSSPSQYRKSNSRISTK